MVWDTVSITSYSSAPLRLNFAALPQFPRHFSTWKRCQKGSGLWAQLPEVWCLDGGLVTPFSVAKLFMFVEVFVMRCSPWNLTIPVDAKKNPGLLILVMQFRFGTKKANRLQCGGKRVRLEVFMRGLTPHSNWKKKHNLTGIVYVGHYTFTSMGVFHSFPLANRQAIFEVRLPWTFRTQSFRVSCLNVDQSLSQSFEGLQNRSVFVATFRTLVFAGSKEAKQMTKNGRFVKVVMLRSSMVIIYWI